MLLNAMACNFGQGYFFAKPLDSKNLTALLQSELARWGKVVRETGATVN